MGDVFEDSGNFEIVLSQQLCVRARGDVLATLVPFWKWQELVSKYPGFEADFRAGEHLVASSSTKDVAC